MAVTTKEPVRRLFPVYFLVDASGSMNENGKWKVVHDLLKQCVDQLKSLPDPDFEIILTLLLLQSGNVVVEYESEPIQNIELRELTSSGTSGYSVGLEKLSALLKERDFPLNAHAPCVLLIGDGHADPEFENALERCLKEDSFSKTTRIVVGVGNDFEASALKEFVSSSNNFFTVMDIATMPYFYMRRASAINSQASQSTTRRLLSS